MDYPLPQFTVDAVLLTLREDRLHVALHRRPMDSEAEPGKLALPGGMVHIARQPGEPEDASAEAAIERVLRDKTGFVPRHLEQLQVFSGRLRDARSWSASLGFVALVPAHELDTADKDVFQFHDVEHLPALAFDHQQIVDAAAAQRAPPRKTGKSPLKRGD